jgi:hypothetical protein
MTVYQFHDIAAVEIKCDSPFAQDFFNAEYGYYCTDAPLPHGLSLATIFMQMASVPPEDFTRYSHKWVARWAYKLIISPAKVDIRVYGNRFAVPMVHHMLVHPSLRWLSAMRGTLLLHAGAVVRNEKSLIFTGKGGTGKTTITSLVMASSPEWQLHADDYVFIQPGATSLAYITRSHLYRNLLKWVPLVSSRLTGWERIRLEFLGRVREWSHERIKWPVRVSPEQLWPDRDIADIAYPAAILLLEHGETANLLPVDDILSTSNGLLEMNFGEARHFLQLLEKAGALDAAWLEAWKRIELNLMEKILVAVPSYRLVLPRSNDASEVQRQVLPLLEKLVC